MTKNKEKLQKNNFNFRNAIFSFTDYLDMADKFLKKQPCFYTDQKIWWAWNFETKSWEMIDKIDLKNLVTKSVTGLKLFELKESAEVLNALTMRARLNIPLDAPKTWVQFKDVIIDIKTGEKIIPSPKYFITNPIKYGLSETTKTPRFDKLFKEWVDPEWVETLYEIIAFSCLPDYPLHRIFCFTGEGRNGKTSYLSIIAKLLGKKNCCSTDLDLLMTNRFESSKMYKKLICEMGEIDAQIFKRTSKLKKLVGDDLLGVEFKGHDGFDTHNYAKLLIATNKLPETTDKTIGFYSKWIAIDFPNHFEEKAGLLDDIPDEEYEALAAKSIKYLKKLLTTSKFTNEGTYAEKEIRYEARSSSINDYIKQFCVMDVNAKIPLYELYNGYLAYCSERGLRKPTKTEVTRILHTKKCESIIINTYKLDGDATTIRGYKGITLVDYKEQAKNPPSNEKQGIQLYETEKGDLNE